MCCTFLRLGPTILYNLDFQDDDCDDVYFCHRDYDGVYFDLYHYSSDEPLNSMQEVSDWVRSWHGNTDEQFPQKLLSLERQTINDIDWVKVETSSWWLSGYLTKMIVLSLRIPSQRHGWRYITLLDGELYICSFSACLKIMAS